GRGGRTARSPLGHRSVTAPRAALSAGPSPTGRHAAGNPVCVRPVPPSQGGIGQFLQQPQENRVLGREAAGSSSQGPASGETQHPSPLTSWGFARNGCSNL
uniref:PCNA-associated factor histone-like domain-containing protein n=1 Tax=Strigops habroptila TaxID=2489341 RepID=A0A672UNK1_STRHB